MISHDFKFICLRIGKNASSSLRECLRPYCKIEGKRKGYTEISIRLSVRQVLNRLDKYELDESKWKEYFKFAFVRNPFDRLVSRYIYGCNFHENRNSMYCKSERTKEDFLEFVINYSKQPGRERPYQYNRLCNKHGIMQMNYIGKLENLKNDFDKICNIIGIEPFDIPKINKTKRKEYRKYYLPETIKIVKEKWKLDLENFAYDF